MRWIIWCSVGLLVFTLSGCLIRTNKIETHYAAYQQAAAALTVAETAEWEAHDRRSDADAAWARFDADVSAESSRMLVEGFIVMVLGYALAGSVLLFVGAIYYLWRSALVRAIESLENEGNGHIF